MLIAYAASFSFKRWKAGKVGESKDQRKLLLLLLLIIVVVVVVFVVAAVAVAFAVAFAVVVGGGGFFCARSQFWAPKNVLSVSVIVL